MNSLKWYLRNILQSFAGTSLLAHQPSPLSKPFRRGESSVPGKLRNQGSISIPVLSLLKGAPMKKLLLGSIAYAALAAGSASAADLPAKAMPPPVPSWAGFYLGLHGGYAWKHDDFSQPAFLFNISPIDGIRSQGAVYGAQAGYNWQFGRIVTGLEIDFSATDIKGANGLSQSAASGGGLSQTLSLGMAESVQFLGSARARLGWTPTNNLLLYGTAGLGWERLDTTVDSGTVFLQGSTPIDVETQSDRTPLTKFGWVAGAGAEVMLGGSNWIGRLEYLHYDMGQVQTATTQTFHGTVTATANAQTIDLVRAALSYKFGEPAAVRSVPYVKAPVAAQLPAWAGFYIGAHGGYAWGRDPHTEPNQLTLAGVVTGSKSEGWIAGGQFGYNWQYDRVVAGLEASLSAADISGNSNIGIITTPTTRTVSFDDRVKTLGTLRGRLGWLPTDTVLLYGTAGLAWERFEAGETTATSTVNGSIADRAITPADQFGWVAGLGAEIMLGSSNWIGRLEYLHYDFGRVIPGTSVVRTPDAYSNSVGHQTVDLVSAGVSYKFGPTPRPEIAPAMYSKAPPPTVQSWAGFYIGGHGGYGWKENDFSHYFFSNNQVGNTGGINSRGWLAGGQSGYNWQYGYAVAGIEIDGSATGIRGSTAPVTASIDTESLSDRVKYLGTVRARLGWTPTSNWLLFATGGMAWEHADRDSNFVEVLQAGVSTSVTDTPRDNFGWVVGAGVETMLGSTNWIARLEYLHYDFGMVEPIFNQIFTIPGATSGIDRGGHQTIDTVRAGMSYKFTP